MLAAGIIRHRLSAYSSMVILVRKKDNTWHMCVDYIPLNKIVILDKFPMLVIEELLDELHVERYISKLDIKYGYHRVTITKGDMHKTSFKTHKGHYMF